MPSHDIEALSLESSSSGQLRKHAPKQMQRSLLQHVWRVVWSNCTWMQALWRDLLCVGFVKQLWKVYLHDVPKVCPSSSGKPALNNAYQHSRTPRIRMTYIS